MIYNGIETENVWKNGRWITVFSQSGTLIKTVEWRGSFDDDDLKNIIDTEIIPFI